MAVYYLDTSAAVKRYVDEAGSAWLRALVEPAGRPLLIASQLLTVEMIGAFARRLRDRTVTQVDYRSDTRLVEAAVAEGLAADSPSLHP